MRRKFTSFELWGVAIFAFIAIVVLPCLNAYLPQNSPFYVSNFYINLYGKYLCYAILAISVDILWGYTGLLSLGQCIFFSLGGYMIGMYLIRMIPEKPIPDFLAMQGWTTLPWFWKPFSSFIFALIMAFLVPGLLAWGFGYLAFRSRIKGVYFSIITQALTYVGKLVFYENEFRMGGNNGFTNYRFVLGYDIRLASTQRALYVISAIMLLLVYILCKWLTGTKYGKIQRGIRDSENRLLFSGYSTASYKLFIFVVASLIASIAGMLYVPQVGIINPSEMEPGKSIEAVIWVAVGGRGTLVGPVVGAIVVNAVRSWATREYPDLWPIILGAIFLLVVLFMPKGIVGVFAQIRENIMKFMKQKPPAVPEPVAPRIETTGTTTVVTKADV